MPPRTTSRTRKTSAPPTIHASLLDTLEVRFHAHRARHAKIDWAIVASRLAEHPDRLRALAEMERTGGEPDVVGADKDTGEILFYDCAAESPAGRRSTCYDAAALAARKEHKPRTSALEMAEAMGISILTEAEYRRLQQLGEFDTKTSSWVWTPPDIRQLGGAVFCDRRYGRVFWYHNGAESYCAARGFRGSLRV